MKRLLLVMALVALALVSCKKEESTISSSTKSIHDLEENISKKRVAIAYFSLNDDVKDVAEKFKEVIDADIVEIIPSMPYTDEDLNYADENSRVRLEDEYNPFLENEIIFDDEYETSEGIILATKSVLNEKKTLKELPNIKKNQASHYDIIILGFPVWHEDAPKVIYTFIKELKNKIVIPFCTDGEMGVIDQYLSNFADKSVRVMSGESFNKDVDVAAIKRYLEELSADFDM